MEFSTDILSLTGLGNIHQHLKLRFSFFFEADRQKLPARYLYCRALDRRTAMLRNQRSKFSLRATPTYLNCAYMAPLLRSVERAGMLGMQRKRNPADTTPADFFTEADALRRLFAQLIGCPDPSRVVIIPSVSYGMATVAANTSLKPGEEVVVAAEQFPSNVYPWQRLCADTGAKLVVVEPPAGLQMRGRRWNERLLQSITAQTRLVAIGHVHWADGTKFDLKAIRARTRDVGARLVIDGTQSVGALPFFWQEFQPDALVCAGYKWLMGPYSIGLAVYGAAFDDGRPVEENWINRKHSENFAQLVNYQTGYQPGALRYEVGERSNFILVPMMIAALKQVLAWGPEPIQSYCEKISMPAVKLLREHGFWIEDETGRAHHLFGIRPPEKVSIQTVRSRFAQAAISVSFRGDSIRVAPHLYNTADEMNRLADLLLKC
jgi:selenocysteine lyase/cysteine desulfurase